MKKQQYILYALNVLIGIVFIVSAILKLISIDSFELYIYSFGFFGLNFSTFLARCFIIIELVLGTGLILNFYPRFFRITSILLLCGFSVFLLYTLLFYGNTDNCHCFGDLVELNPLPSLIKNVVFIAVLAFTSKVAVFSCQRKKLISLLLSGALLLSIFIISPPDNWFGFGKKTGFDEFTFNELLQDKETITDDLTQGTKIICFFGLGCQYCELAAKKLYLIQQNNPDFEMDFVGIFWGKNERYDKFAHETKLSYSHVYFTDPIRFLKITDGKMPLVLILKNGVPVNYFNYRELQEKSLIKSLAE